MTRSLHTFAFTNGVPPPSEQPRAGERDIRENDTQGLLANVMRATRVALLDASGEGLEIDSFSAPCEPDHPYGLDGTQVAPGTSWFENVYPSDRAKLKAYLAGIGEGTTGHSVDYRLIVGEGELLWVRHWTLGLTLEAGRGYYRNIIMPIPEQKHLEWECLRVSERECNRIGQELHDDLCQVLAGLMFMMRVVGQKARKLDAALADEIDELNSHVIGATDRVRSMAHGLFPAQLNYATLGDALTAFATEARMLFRIEVKLDLPAEIPKHAADQIIHIYRIVQESVSNAVRHGKASAVSLALTNTRRGLQLRIEDNGAGLPAGASRPEGIGVHVMQYRARVLGGTFELRNGAAGGASAELVYPATPPTAQPSSLSNQ